MMWDIRGCFGLQQALQVINLERNINRDGQTMIQIDAIEAFSDNYIWCIYDDNSRQALVVDPGDAEPVERALNRKGLTLTGILVTHHHFDHTGGIQALLDKHSVPVYGPHSDNIATISERLADGDTLEVLGLTFTAITIPGHTLDHIALYCASDAILFCGDTLFAGGCGRVFEGNPDMMHQSLAKLAALPGSTRVYCAHEYTLANLNFAMAVDKSNPHLQQRFKDDQANRDKGVPTVPSMLTLELLTNPFLRCSNEAIIAAAAQHSGTAPAQPEQVFAVIRGWKDEF